MKTWTNLMAIGALAVALTACSSQAEEKKAEITKAGEPISVKAIALTPEAIAVPVVGSGQFTTDDEALLAFKLGGVVDRILVEEGQPVRRGQLLATLNLTEIEAGVRQAELGLEKAERDARRIANLFKDSVVTLEQKQNVQTTLDLAQRQVEAARFNRQFSEIRALKDGFVLRKYVNPGQVVSSGQEILKTNGASQTAWKLKVGLADRDWALVQVGDRATIETDIAGLTALTGRVTRKAESADPANGAFVVEISLDHKPKGLAAGMFGKASIATSQAQLLARVPYAALLDGNQAEAFVFTTADGKTARRKAVVVQSLAKDEALVSGGIAAGEQVIVSGGPYLTDGSLIRLQ